MLLHKWMILSLLITATPLFASSTFETDILSHHNLTPHFSQNEPNCVDCFLLQPEHYTKCPTVIDYIIKQTLSHTLYNYVTGKKLLDTCLTSTAASDTTNTKLNDKINDKLNVKLSQLLDQDFQVSPFAISSCFSQNDVNFHQISMNKQEAQSVITGYMHTLNKNIFDNQLSSLKQLGFIDRLLGKPPLGNFQCDQRFEKDCKKIKTCKSNSTLKEITKLSLNSFKEINLLKQQLQDLKTLRSKNTISRSDQELATQDITSKIKMIEDVTPWLKGDSLSSATKEISKNIAENKLDIAEKIFIQSFKNQLSKTQNLIKDNYYKGNMSFNCLKNNLGCTSDVVDNLNSFMVNNYASKNIPLSQYNEKDEASRKSFREAQYLNQSLRSGACVGDLLNNKKEIDESAMLIASTGIGLMVSGVGGVLELGKTALTFYQAGNQLKGLASLGLLALDGASMVKSYSDVANECKKSINHLEQVKLANLQSLNGCNEEPLDFNVTNLNSCIVNISITTLPYLLNFKASNIIPSIKLEKAVAKDIVQDAIQVDKPIFLEKFVSKKLDQYEKFKFESLKKKMITMGKSEDDASREAEILANQSKNIFKQKYYACQSKTLTPEIQVAAKRYTAFTVALSTGSTAFGYYENNKDKFSEQKKEFFGKLSYEIAMSYLLSKVSAKITSSPNGSFLDRYIAGNVNSAKIGLIDATVYSQYFGVSEDEARKKIEEVTHSPDSLQDLKILDTYINKTNLIEKFKTNIINSYQKILNSPNKDVLMDNSSIAPKIDNFSHLSKEDLQKPEIKEKLIKAVMEEMNSGRATALLSTGDKGVDRWINDRTWQATLGAPRSIVVGLGLFQVLCLGADNPALSLGIATSLQFANQMLASGVYFKFKKEFIGM